MLISTTLYKAVLQSGCLPHYAIFYSDHCPYFLDLDAHTLFSEPTYKIARPISRPLIQDPRIVDKYCSTLISNLSYQNFYEILDTLTNQIQTNTSSEYIQVTCNKIDQIITESIPDSSLAVVEENIILASLKHTNKELREGHKQHTQLRHEHLEALAEAIILARCPGLQHESMQGIHNERTIKLLKTLFAESDYNEFSAR
jgi:hypothetical protein